mmetsp:Transcript_37716/g.106574  ORF Transcript_37716/g.106574 Transcript_37716/m.106574 type:complete len:208 (+) Transcript_37716:3061-3684(+)
MEDSVVKVCVGVGAGPRPKEAIALLRTQEGDVLHDVSHPLLVLLLIHAPHVYLEMGLKALWWDSIRKDDVFHPIVKLPSDQVRVRRQLLAQKSVYLCAAIPDNGRNQQPAGVPRPLNCLPCGGKPVASGGTVEANHGTSNSAPGSLACLLPPYGFPGAAGEGGRKEGGGGQQQRRRPPGGGGGKGVSRAPAAARPGVRDCTYGRNHY